MMSTTRRVFLGGLAVSAGSVFAQRRTLGAASANETLRVGVMGLARGLDLARSFARTPGAEVAYVCDVDERRLSSALEEVAKLQTRRPQAVKDFRRILDDRAVDALVVAAPDHWHAAATIRACAAGKHVYVEKPISHNAREGELMIAAARKHGRVVQVGTQRRTMPMVVEAIAKVRAGELGSVKYARSWYHFARPSIGRGKPAPLPAWLDYDLWQGPAPEQPYRDNVVHYNWHWFWHWGTGELGNNGVHTIDVCRWGLGVDYPRSVTAGGGRFRFDDDQETPDTQFASFDFGDKTIVWEGRNWPSTPREGEPWGIIFYGDRATLVMDDAGYRIFDPRGKELRSAQGGSLTHEPHVQDFLDCARKNRHPAADIEEGHKSTLLCHLGNIAYRVGRTIRLDDAKHQIVGDNEASQLWGRQYRAQWRPEI